MKTVKQILQEGKQVGVIYHFCKMSTIMDLMNLDVQKQYGADKLPLI